MYSELKTKYELYQINLTIKSEQCNRYWNNTQFQFVYQLWNNWIYILDIEMSIKMVNLKKNIRIFHDNYVKNLH